MNPNEQFLANDYIPLLKKLSGSEKGNWGVLSPQGMVEHMTNSVGEAWGRIPQKLITPPDKLEASRTFMLGDKEFRPNTKNVLMGDQPDALRHSNMADAVNELERELQLMVEYHRSNPNATFMSAFFGELNYEQWLHLLRKHAVHHLKQFSLL